MKILSRKLIPNQTCECCGCVCKIDYKDLKDNFITITKTDWICPLCKTKQGVKFNKN